MVDATERGGALAAVYRQIKRKDGSVMRLDRAKVLEESAKMAKAKGDGRNQPMAKEHGSKGPIKESKPGKKK